MFNVFVMFEGEPGAEAVVLDLTALMESRTMKDEGERGRSGESGTSESRNNGMLECWINRSVRVSRNVE